MRVRVIVPLIAYPSHQEERDRKGVIKGSVHSVSGCIRGRLVKTKKGGLRL